LHGRGAEEAVEPRRGRVLIWRRVEVGKVGVTVLLERRFCDGFDTKVKMLLFSLLTPRLPGDVFFLKSPILNLG
jgi:hypothetical protein